MSKLQTYLNQQPTIGRAVVAYFCRGNEILLGVRKRVSEGLGEQLMAGIGGKVEPGETNEQAMQRECLEEIGVKVTRWRRVGVDTFLFPHKPKWNQVATLYLVDAWEGEPQETIDIKPVWVSQVNLPIDRMWPDNVIVIPLLLAGKRVTGTFLYSSDGTIEDYTLEHATTTH